MWQFIKHKLAKLGCFFLIALLMIAVTGITKFVMGLMNYDKLEADLMGRQVGMIVGFLILGVCCVFGSIIFVKQLSVEMQERRREKEIAEAPSKGSYSKFLRKKITKHKS
jgi:uncharacterized membrane protein YuzA (DUF378 family)